jgi:hypothetical protein
MAVDLSPAALAAAVYSSQCDLCNYRIIPFSPFSCYGLQHGSTVRITSFFSPFLPIKEMKPFFL